MRRMSIVVVLFLACHRGYPPHRTTVTSASESVTFEVSGGRGDLHDPDPLHGWIVVRNADRPSTLTFPSPMTGGCDPGMGHPLLPPQRKAVEAWVMGWYGAGGSIPFNEEVPLPAAPNRLSLEPGEVREIVRAEWRPHGRHAAHADLCLRAYGFESWAEGYAMPDR